MLFNQEEEWPGNTIHGYIFTIEIWTPRRRCKVEFLLKQFCLETAMCGVLYVVNTPRRVGVTAMFVFEREFLNDAVGERTRSVRSKLRKAIFYLWLIIIKNILA